MQTRDRVAEPSQLFHRGLGRRCPDDALHNLAAVGALHRQIVQLIGARAHHDLQPQLFSLFAQPDTAKIIAANPAEVIAAQPKQRAVINHAAMFIAHGRIDHLPHCQLFDIACQGVLHQRLGIGAGDFELAQGRQVDGDRGVAAGPVFLDWPCGGIGIGQPVAAIFHHVASAGGRGGVEGGFFGHLRLCLGCGAPSDRARKGFSARIGAHMDVGKIPAIGWRSVVRAGRVHADQIG